MTKNRKETGKGVMNLIIIFLSMGIMIGCILGCEAGEYMQKTIDNTEAIDRIKKDQYKIDTVIVDGDTMIVEKRVRWKKNR